MAECRDNRRRKAKARKRLKVWKAKRLVRYRYVRSFSSEVIELLAAKVTKDINRIEDAHFLAEIESQLSA